jgi:hypothetical protein
MTSFRNLAMVVLATAAGAVHAADSVPKSGTVTGIILPGSGAAPTAAIGIRRENTRTEPRVPVKVGAPFRLADLSIGWYELTIGGVGIRHLRIRVEVKQGITTVPPVTVLSQGKCYTSGMTPNRMEVLPFESQQVARVRGTVFGDRWNRTAGVNVRFSRSGGAVGTPVDTVTDANGSYAIHPLAPGKYTVRFDRTGYSAREVADVLLQRGFDSTLPPVNLLPCSTGRCAETVRFLPASCPTVRRKAERLFAHRGIKMEDEENCIALSSPKVVAAHSKAPATRRGVLNRYTTANPE